MGRRGMSTLIGGALCCAALITAAPAAALTLGDVLPGPLGLTTTCDELDPAVCLYPWPNDRFTRPDPTTDTGKRLALPLLGMPRNIAGKPIDPVEFNRNDGFSPGNLIVTKVPGLTTQKSFDVTGLVPLTDIARYADADQAAVVINARTRERHPIWAEVDFNPADGADRTLILRPARNFDEGERYIVALRRLKGSDGSRLPAQQGFRIYRDRIATTNGAIERRRPHMESLFATLGAAGIGRTDLYLAWDFTVASQRSLSERVLAIRDDAFAKLGDTNLADLQVQGRSPTFVVNPDLPDGTTDVELPIDLPDLPLDPLDLLSVRDLDGIRNFAPCSAGSSPACEEGENDLIARRVAGQVVVPCYLNLPGCVPGSRFAYLTPSSTNPVAIPGNVTLANVLCVIPRRAIDQGERVKPSLYGHGLLGGAGEVGGGNIARMAQEHGYLFCATDWTGMSTYDVPNVATLLVDLSNFATLTDRGQQGFVNFSYLGRAMIHPGGFSSHPAFQVDGRSVIDTSRLFYDGNSQGGIMGGALAAIAPDFERAVLGVPAMNYSTLLRRSVDFDTYAVVMYRAYPKEIERPLVLSLIQLLWDRAEANGYAHHMTGDPLPNTPAHKVLLHPAYGDHQVTNFAADVEARTIGAKVHAPVLFDIRPQHLGTQLLAPIGAYPFDGSAMVYWDTGPESRPDGRGVGDPPVDELPNRAGRDPHSAPRNDAQGRHQKAAFLRDGGAVIDVCDGLPCRADGWAGP